VRAGSEVGLVLIPELRGLVRHVPGILRASG
jgi:hypothetical protein